MVPLCNECARAANGIPAATGEAASACSVCERPTTALAPPQHALASLQAYAQRCMGAIRAAMAPAAKPQSPQLAGAIVVPQLQERR